MRERANSFPSTSWSTGVWLTGALLLPAVLIALAGNGVVDHLLLDRERLFAGEAWRIVSGHWVHLTPAHLAWDAAVFLLLGALCDRADRRAFLTTIALSTGTVTATVLVARPDIVFYAGLSGIDSALFGLLATGMFARAIKTPGIARAVSSATLIAAFLCKTAYELVTVRTVFVPDVDAAVPVPIAHVAGFATGAAVAALRAARAPSTSWIEA